MQDQFEGLCAAFTVCTGVEPSERERTLFRAMAHYSEAEVPTAMASELDLLASILAIASRGLVLAEYSPPSASQCA